MLEQSFQVCVTHVLKASSLQCILRTSLRFWDLELRSFQGQDLSSAKAARLDRHRSPAKASLWVKYGFRKGGLISVYVLRMKAPVACCVIWLCKPDQAWPNYDYSRQAAPHRKIWDLIRLNIRNLRCRAWESRKFKQASIHDLGEATHEE